MNSSIGHLQINVDPQNIPFYKDLFTFLGWTMLYDTPEVLGVGSGSASLWFTPPLKTLAGDYDGKGLNHLGISVTSQDDIDRSTVYLEQHGVQPLFNTPCHRPEFSAGPSKTYYQVMFESPDRILLEIVYTGDKA